MSKRKATINLGGMVDLKVVIDPALLRLLKEGKIKHVLAWKPIEKKPSIVEIASADGLEESIQVKCTLMDSVGFGYLPEGYPSSYTTKGKMTRLTVELAGGEIPAQESTEDEQTNEPES